jgi:hypothetical protein
MDLDIAEGGLPFIFCDDQREIFRSEMASVKNDHIGLPLRLQRVKYPGSKLP